jgi:ATP-dependent Clp protease protease subunit
VSAGVAVGKAPEITTDSWVTVSGVIDAQLADEIVQQLIALDSQPGTGAIGMRISSPGGSLMDVLGICDVMRSLRRPVITIAVGKAMSGGALILSSGTYRYVGKHSLIMLHRPELTTDNWSFGFKDLKLLEVAFEKIEDQVYRLLAETTNRPESDIRRVLTDEMWFTAEEAVTFGLADGILEQSSLRLRDDATKQQVEPDGSEQEQLQAVPPVAELHHNLSK